MYSYRMTWATLACMFFGVFIFPCETYGECKIPELWDGTWFIRELDRGFPIIINSRTNTISRRSSDMLGNCTWSKDGFYVFRDIESACRKCLFIEEKHKNVLYSKEGVECKPDKEWDKEDDPEKNLCHNLMNDQNQNHYFWIRQDYKKIDCPFRGLSFEFSYRKDTTTCGSPVSHASSCMEHTTLKLEYEACHDQKDSVAKAELLTCVGEWNESNIHYFVADVRRINSPRNSSPQERFRCFISQEESEPNPDSTRPSTLLGYNVGTAELATCSGLHSPETAETTLFLKKETFVGADWKPCSFPRWLSDHKWMDMGSTVEFFLPLQFKNRTIHIVPRDRQYHRDVDKDHGRGFFPLSHSNLRCLERANVTGEEDDGHIAVLARYSVGCRIDLACIHFVKRSDYIFQLYYMPRREMSRKQYKTNCLNSTISEFHKEATMISTSGTKTPCPIKGNFSVNMVKTPYIDDSSTTILNSSPDSWLSQILNASDSQWSIGCRNDESVDVELQTSMSLELQDSLSLNHLFCLDSWTEKQVHYTVVTAGTGEPGTLLCMASREIQANESSQHPKAILTTKDCIKLRENGILYPKVIDGVNSDDTRVEDVDPVGYPQLELIEIGPCNSPNDVFSDENHSNEQTEVRDGTHSRHSNGDSALSANITRMIPLFIILQFCYNWI